MNTIATTYFVRVRGKRPPFPSVAHFLWGLVTDFDSDGNSSTLADADWTELTLNNREADGERIDVNPASESPLVLKVEGKPGELTARAAFFLATTSDGDVSKSLNGPYSNPTELEAEMGDFDAQAALQRAIH